MYSAVLIALDGSEAAATALPRALEVAGALSLRLVLLRVVPSNKDRDHQREHDLMRSQAEGYVESLKRSLGARGVLVESIVESGEPAAVILSAARSLGCPLLVICATGANSQGKHGLGDVARAVLRHSEGPVLVVRPPERGL